MADSCLSARHILTAESGQNHGDPALVQYRTLTNLVGLEECCVPVCVCASSAGMDMGCKALPGRRSRWAERPKCQPGLPAPHPRCSQIKAECAGKLDPDRWANQLEMGNGWKAARPVGHGGAVIVSGGTDICQGGFGRGACAEFI